MAILPRHETTVTKADLIWLLKFVDNYEYVLDAYPEMFDEEDIDDIKVVKQLLREKLDEITSA